MYSIKFSSFEGFTNEDWDRSGKFEPRWGPFWWLNGFKNLVHDFLEPCEEVNTESVKWDEDELHEPVPEFKDELWNKEKELNDWPKDAPDEFPDDPVDLPEPVVDDDEDGEDEPLDLPEDVNDEPSEPNEEAWEKHDKPDDEFFDLDKDLNEWQEEVVDWEVNVFIDEDLDFNNDIKEEIIDFEDDPEDQESNQSEESDKD